ncbi:MAG: acylneuraminate cytidylyltransferase family protein [Xanthobacteraceae bacterium]|nr:acylneuraminate cytidylyltransferase family protein [Xanthobacteraceae bacterium]
MKALGIIPARGGSKGVPRKNVRIVGGIPLIGHTIRAAQNSKRLVRFVVSTDDAEIAETAERFGAQVLKRPSELARDDSPVDGAIRHALDKAGYECDTIALLQPTTPLRSSDDIDAALELFANGGADTVIGITQVGDRHPSRMYRLADGLMNPILPEPAGRLRQQLEPIFIRNGAIYICSAAQLCATNSLFGPRLRGYVMPAERAVNIDEEIDLVVADYLLTKQRHDGQQA